MKRLVMILTAAVIVAGSMSAQVPDQKHPMSPRGNAAAGAENIEGRLDFLSGKLNLTEQQSAKLRELFTEQKAERQKADEKYRAEMDELRSGHRAEMEKMAQKNRDEMEKILTPEQIETFKAMQAARNERRMAERPHHRNEPGFHRHHPAPEKACPCCRKHVGPADGPRHQEHRHGQRPGCGR